MLAGYARLFDRVFRDSPLVGLLPGIAFPPDFHLQPLAERVDDGDSDAVQSAGDFVTFGVELSAGVEHRHDDLGGRPLLFFVIPHRNATAVIDYGDGVVHVNGHLNLRAEPSQRLVHRVIHHLIDQMVQAALARRADIHGRALPHRLEVFQHLDAVGVVAFWSRLGRSRDIWFHISHSCFFTPYFYSITLCSTTLSAAG